MSVAKVSPIKVCAFAAGTNKTHGEALSLLSDRELQVFRLIGEGSGSKDIAHQLNISIKTVETHRATAMQKLKFRTTAELVRYAVRNRIVEP